MTERTARRIVRQAAAVVAMTYWLDFGGGDAEYCERLAQRADDGENIFISVDPLLRVHVIKAGRVRSRGELPANVFRVGAGLDPSEDLSGCRRRVRYTYENLTRSYSRRFSMTRTSKTMLEGGKP